MCPGHQLTGPVRQSACPQRGEREPWTSRAHAQLHAASSHHPAAGEPRRARLQDTFRAQTSETAERAGQRGLSGPGAGPCPGRCGKGGNGVCGVAGWSQSGGQVSGEGRETAGKGHAACGRFSWLKIRAWNTVFGGLSRPALGAQGLTHLPTSEGKLAQPTGTEDQAAQVSVLRHGSGLFGGEGTASSARRTRGGARPPGVRSPASSSGTAASPPARQAPEAARSPRHHSPASWGAGTSGGGP